MTKIFISYRRSDSQYVTDSIHDYMMREFGTGNVFLDVGSIPFGVDFRSYIAEQIAAHDVVLVVIGPEWGRMMQERAEQENDFVRIEIESALQQDKLVIPVLVMEARMPDFRGLPASIGDLQWRNSAVIRRKPDLEHDCQRLAEGIRQYARSAGWTAAQVARAKPRSIDMLPAPFGWIEIPHKRYSISRYPVTNGHFAKFIEAGGYHERKYWADAGWQECQDQGWTEPRYWQDAKRNGPDYPVVGVSWYEATAFCLWLSDVTGERITLPTEEQWQYAAQGDDGRAYPWGDEWDCKRCNNSVEPCGSDGTSPVRRYEGVGDSPFGVADMAGNAGEWCLTGFEVADIEVEDIHVVRGGAWSDEDPDYFRCDSSNWGARHNWYINRGFRICLLPE